MRMFLPSFPIAAPGQICGATLYHSDDCGLPEPPIVVRCVICGAK